jgi:prevent-host-death family protein
MKRRPMHTVTVEEAKSRLADLVKEVQDGREVVIVQDNAPIVKMVPAVRPGFGSLKGQLIMADDFDAPLDDFADYMP